MINVYFVFDDREPLTIEFKDEEDMKNRFDISQIAPQSDTNLVLIEEEREGEQLLSTMTRYFSQKNLIAVSILRDYDISNFEKLLEKQGLSV